MYGVHRQGSPRLHDRRASSDTLSDQHVPRKRGGHHVAARDPGRPKQKRNKPTLNCLACVQRKVKCDRGKPACLACQRRETNCVYASRVQPKTAAPEHVLRLIELSKRQKTGDDATSPGTIESGGSGTKTPTTLVLRGRSTSAEPLLTKVPYATFSTTNVYSLTTQHPFTNYWTLAGGRKEVLTALPSKEQADILIAKYFDSIDSIFPFPHYPKYQDQYDEFWSLSDEEKAQVDTDFLCLLFVKLALGAQFVRTPGDVATNQAPAAELYASACQQCLHLSGYLHHTSILTLRSMNLMTYYLTNANRTPDSWSFGGIEIRQSYAMGINRDASRVQRPPEETVLERHQRRRLWQSMVALDASKATVLKMPPSATHGDQPSYASDPYYNRLPATNPTVPIDVVLSPFLALAPFEPASDTKYTEDMYALGLLAQEFISSPRSLGVPVASSPLQRNAILAKFQACYDDFPAVFKAWSDSSLAELCATGFQGRRTVRQIFLLTGHYWYYVMLVYADQSASATEELVKGCLIAAHEALRPFFVLPTLLEGEAGIWWLIAHRAFAAATTMANLLRHHHFKPHHHSPPPSSTTTEDPISSHWRQRPSSPSSSSSYGEETQAMFTKARVDIERMLGILRQLATHDQVSRSRVEILEGIFGGEQGDGGEVRN